MIWELYLLFLEKIYTVYFSVWFLNIAISSCHSTSLASNTRKRNGRKAKMAKIKRFCIVTGSIRFILSRKKGKRERGPIREESDERKHSLWNRVLGAQKLAVVRWWHTFATHNAPHFILLATYPWAHPRVPRHPYGKNPRAMSFPWQENTVAGCHESVTLRYETSVK